MKIYELNYLENVKESSLVNGGLSLASGSAQAFAKGYFTLAITKSIVSVSPNNARASNSASAYALGGVAFSSSSASAYNQNVYYS